MITVAEFAGSQRELEKLIEQWEASAEFREVENERRSVERRIQVGLLYPIRQSISQLSFDEEFGYGHHESFKSFILTDKRNLHDAIEWLLSIDHQRS